MPGDPRVSTTPRALGSRYELLDRIGRGAMGEVWRARDRREDVLRAAKLLRPEHAGDADIVARFVRERSILVGLRHPHVVRVHDLVVEGEDLAIVMDLVPGDSLATVLRRRRTLPPATAVELTTAVLEGLDAAHRAGTVHRDVKPDNVLLRRTAEELEQDEPTAEDVLLTDFGIARITEEAVVATGLLGTPGYMPPELFTEGTTGPATDVYATGVMLYEMLAGRTPYAGKGTAHTVGHRHVTSAPPPLDVPEPLWRALEHMLAKGVDVRATVEEARAELAEALEHLVGVPALEPQADPDRWDAAAAEEPATNLHAGLPDEEGTHLRGVPAAAPVARGTGAPVALVGGDMRQADDDGEGETLLGGRATTYRRPELATQAAAEDVVDPAKRRRTIIVVVTVLVLLAALGYAATRLLGSDEEEAPEPGGAAGSGEVSERLDLPSTPTGLEVALEATAVADSEDLDLTVTYEAGGTPLLGEFLVVLPLVQGDCTPVVWGDAVARPNTDVDTTGVSAACAYLVDPGEVPANGQKEARATVTLAADDQDRSDQVRAWLDAVDEGTEAALAGITSGNSFPAQRLEGITLVVPTSVQRDRAGRQPLPVTVLAEYGYTEDREPIFNSRTAITGDPSSVLQAVADGYEGVSFQPCSQLSLENQGLAVSVRTVGECSLGLEVGELETETTLVIRNAGG